MDREELLRKLDENRSLGEGRDEFFIDSGRIISVTQKIRILFFPDYFRSTRKAEDLLDAVYRELDDEIAKIDVNHEMITKRFMDTLPDVQAKLFKDIEAIYNGDPSATTYTEIVNSFPGFKAIYLYRIAHELYELKVPIIPRIITEYAHEKTGIDINPGAKIGEYFCIDHGTGIVVGETAVVGDHVRMYHGVTLGVRNFRKDENGNLLKGGKRHPNIGNNVILYANATVLGGDTCIADNSVVPAGSLILHTPETFL